MTQTTGPEWLRVEVYSTFALVNPRNIVSLSGRETDLEATPGA